jgi:hypothetical protein
MMWGGTAQIAACGAGISHSSGMLKKVAQSVLKSILRGRSKGCPWCRIWDEEWKIKVQILIAKITICIGTN